MTRSDPGRGPAQGYTTVMQQYRRAWLVWWGLFALVGTVVAVVLWSGPAVGLAWIFGATVGAFFAIGVGSTTEEVTPFADLDLRSVWRFAGAGALVASGVAGWADVSSGGAAALVGLAVLTCPPLVRLGLRLGGRAPGVQPAPRSAAHLDRAVQRLGSLKDACQGMTTLELCYAWQQTFVGSSEHVSPAQEMQLLAVRQTFLDELTRRNPAGLEAWMASLTPVHVAPTAFFATGPDTQAA